MSNKIALIFGQYDHPVQPYLTNWTKSLEAHGLQVFRFDFSGKNHPSTYSLGSKNVNEKWRRFAFNIKMWPVPAFTWLFKSNSFTLRRRMKLWAEYGPIIALRPNTIHIVNSYLYPKFAGWVQVLQTPIIVSFRGNDLIVRPWVDKVWQKNLADMFSHASGFHFVSRYLLEEGVCLGAPREKSKVIYPGVDINFYSPIVSVDTTITRQPLTLLTVGRLVWQKGYPYALEAVKILIESGLDVQYWIVGSGDEEGHLRYLIRLWGMEEKIKLLGSKAPFEVKELLQQSDIYIHPSVTEAIPVAILEAAACGKPIIASWVGGIPEAILHEQNGILCTPASATELAHKIRDMWESPYQMRYYAENALKRVRQEFSLVRETEQWINWYQNLAG